MLDDTNDEALDEGFEEVEEVHGFSMDDEDEPRGCSSMCNYPFCGCQ